VDDAVAMIVRFVRVMVVPMIVIDVSVHVRVNDPVEVFVEVLVARRPIRLRHVAHAGRFGLCASRSVRA
jgi:hypothetical protein